MKKYLLILMAIVFVCVCAFGLVACDFFEEPEGHTHNYQWVDNGDGTHKQHCSVNGCNVPNINIESHTWGNDNKCEKCKVDKPAEGHTHDYQWVDNGDGTHKQHCSVSGCDVPNKNIESHTWGNDNKCEKCKVDKPAEGHTHDYQWVDNGDGTHKQYCSVSGCTLPNINVGSHNYGTDGVCICGNVEEIKGTVGLTYNEIKDGETVIAYEVSGIENKDITDIVIPSEYNGKPVTGIGDSAFSSCKKLVSVKLPDSLKSIGYRAFSSCKNLASIAIPNKVESIEGYAFASCENITSIIIPNSVTSIGDGVFSNCDSLTNVTISNNVESIGGVCILVLRKSYKRNNTR